MDNAAMVAPAADVRCGRAGRCAHRTGAGRNPARGCRGRAGRTAGRVFVRIVDIDDDGPGIDPAMAESMFEPFVRAERSRSRSTGGSGLGLTISRAIARAHGGDVVLRNRTEGGLRATISFKV